MRERLGPDVYRGAVRAALHAIAVAVLDEAERRGGVDRLSGEILRFRQGIRQEKGTIPAGLITARSLAVAIHLLRRRAPKTLS